MLDVSVCIPVHNEKLALRETIEELRAAMERLTYTYEIIVVDDGSTDGCIDDIVDMGVRIIRHKRQLGGGVARVTAMRHAKGRIILQSDADGTYPCDQIPEILRRMDHADLVIAARRSESATHWRLLRLCMKWILKTLASVLSRRKIPDLNSGMRAYDRRLGLRYAYLYPKGHSIMSTMTLAFLTEGLIVDFVEIDYRQRKGKSSFRPIQDTYNYTVTIIRTVAYFDPLRVLMPVSIFFFFLAVGFTVRDLFYRDIGDMTPLAWITALIMIVLAIMSDQFSRVSRQIAYMRDDYWTGAEATEEPWDRSEVLKKTSASR